MQWLLMTAGPARWLICLECGVSAFRKYLGLECRGPACQVHPGSLPRQKGVSGGFQNEWRLDGIMGHDIHLTAGCNCNWCAVNEHERQKAGSTNERKQRSEVAWGAPGSTGEQILDTRRRGGGGDLETILSHRFLLWRPTIQFKWGISVLIYKIKKPPLKFTQCRISCGYILDKCANIANVNLICSIAFLFNFLKSSQSFIKLHQNKWVNQCMTKPTTIL